MKGIILAGGSGTRLYPSTLVQSKQLLPIYDKPMIYYPLSVFMLAGIREILIISNVQFIPLFKHLLQDGSHLGIKIEYAIQDKPNGLAEAFIIAEEFIGNSCVSLILGDNIFYGNTITGHLQDAIKVTDGVTIFGYHVNDPERYGVAEISLPDNKVISIEEKPQKPKSNYAITGLYVCDNSVVERAKNVKLSARGELEITSVLESYLAEGKCNIKLLNRGVAWLDMGTHDGLLDASNFIAVIEKRQGYKIACLEEIAYNMGYINDKQLLKLATQFAKSNYGLYIKSVLKRN